MTRFRIILLAVLVGIFALEGDASGNVALPALYDVTDVKSNDTLRVRPDPNDQRDAIGAFAPNATGIEVIELSANGKWGAVNWEDRSGWVAMRFLKLRAVVDPADFPSNLGCFGTEPFWTLDFNADNTAVGDWLFEAVRNYPTVWSGPASNRAPGTFGVSLSDGQSEVHGIVKRELCDDGMSEHIYGYSVDLIHSQPSGNRVLSGCCNLVSR